MPAKPYGMICPITHAAQVLEPRWTLAIITEMWAGSSRFNDIRRGIGSISPALLSRRLKELEEMGLIERVEDKAAGTVDYLRTQRALDLEPALNLLAEWAQCNIEANTALCDANLSVLMWKMRGYIQADVLPNRQTVIQFRYSDPDLEYDTYWALHRPGSPLEICTQIPGFEVDLFVETSKTSLIAILLGRSTVARELENERLFLSGDPVLARGMPRWLKISEYSNLEGIEMLGASPETIRKNAVV